MAAVCGRVRFPDDAATLAELPRPPRRHPSTDRRWLEPAAGAGADGRRGPAGGADRSNPCRDPAGRRRRARVRWRARPGIARRADRVRSNSPTFRTANRGRGDRRARRPRPGDRRRSRRLRAARGHRRSPSGGDGPRPRGPDCRHELAPATARPAEAVVAVGRQPAATRRRGRVGRCWTRRRAPTRTLEARPRGDDQTGQPPSSTPIVG